MDNKYNDEKMNIKDYIDILRFILENQNCELDDDSLKEFIDLLFGVPINHKKVKDFIYYILSNESLI